MKRLLGICLFYVLLAVVLLPFLVTALCGGFRHSQPQEATPLYRSADLAPLESELEEYVVGVVAAEMPAAFPEEALKAQAVAARTYQLRQSRAAGTDAVLYDVGQAYCSEQQQREKWGENYAQYAAKIRRAVRDTAGEIMIYDGEPILAAFHAQSSGKTESAENVWSSPLPYLQSVDSSGDLSAPDHQTQLRLSASELLKKLQTIGDVGCTAAELRLNIQSRTEAGYVDAVQAGNLRLSGRQLRELLSLRSANFTVGRQGDDFVFTVYGYGHGAGMSQYGAAALAEQGKSYREILQHYYTGVQFAQIKSL